MVIFRVDADENKGYGHLTRCIYLAKELKTHKIDILFVVLAEDKKCSLILEGFNYIALTNNLPHSASYIDELEFISKQVGSKSTLLIDGFSFDLSYEQCAQHFFSYIITIDGMGKEHDCHLVIAPSELPTSTAVNPRYTPVFKHGINYVLTNPELLSCSWNRKNPKENSKTGHLLINLGGSEHIEQVQCLLDRLVSIDFSGEVTVIGCMLSNEAYPTLHLTSILWTNELHQLLSNVDAVIGAAGVSAWERAVIGIPSIVFVLAENQFHVAKKLEDVNAATVIAANPLESSEEMLDTEIRRILFDHELRNIYHMNSRHCIDGRGVQRASEEIIKLVSGLLH